ncbi:MAG: FAD-dependent monooxygenase, partial [Sandaracinaceae bacterium]|nr:FAD-dependent monooxygenase [Sandaracinaceae bacterium]
MERFDAVVVGGGVSGSTSAAALARQGLRVLVCEAGLPSDRRLAGELMHPPAARDLDELGLLEPLRAAGAAPVYGFAIFRSASDPGTLLSYSEVRGQRSTSVAIEHAVLARPLLAAVREREGVTVWDARVTRVDEGSRESAVVIDRGGVEHTVRTPLVVLADGRDSRLRARSGIDVERGEELRMIGYRVPGGRLPYPGYGHVFLGPGGTTLAYQISHDDVRIMFELAPHEDVPSLDGLPATFRADVERAMASEVRLAAKVYALRAFRASRGSVAVVGDAAGCVHPLTAGGIAFATGDAVRLAREIGRGFEAGRGVPAALARRDRGRSEAMRTRAALGPALLEALTSDEAAMRLLR